MSEATKNVRRSRGDAPYNLEWFDYFPAMGGNVYFVRPVKSGRGIATLTKEMQPEKPGVDFSISNSVCRSTYWRC